MDHESHEAPTLLLTGATGFVGSRLLGALGEEPVRCLVRDAAKLGERPSVEVIEADVMELETLGPALEGIEEAYYLVHSMEPGGGAGFADKDRQAAENFASAAGEAGVRRVVYLGGVESSAGEESEHLKSRTEVEEILRDGVDELVAIHASMIVGAGSESFRTMVQLVDRLPVLALPSWRDRRSQPVGIDNVIAALLAARGTEPGTYDIAGADTLTFERMTQLVGELLGDEKRSIPLPFSSAKLESVASAAIADADRELLEPLLAGLHGDLLVEQNALETVFDIEPTSFRDAAETAIAGMQD